MSADDRSVFRVRLTLDETVEVQADEEDEEDEAVALAWDAVMDSGCWGAEVTEPEEGC